MALLLLLLLIDTDSFLSFVIFDDDNFFNNVFAAAFGDAFLSFILLVGDSILFESLNLDEPREPDLNNLSEPDVFMLILLGDISL